MKYMDDLSGVLEVKNLVFGYRSGQRIVNDISFELTTGRVSALIGANGCGKSTLFKLITGALKAEDGAVFYNGTDIRRLRQRDFAKNVAVVHQYNTAPSDMTVRKLVELGRTPHQRRLFGRFEDEDKRAVEEAMQLTDTKKFEDIPVSLLSGGQKQRVWLAMALAQEPKLLLLDEITTYLDIHYQIELLSMIKELNIHKKITVLMVLHDINQAVRFADEIIVMKEGQVLALGEVKDVVGESVLNEAFDVETKIVSLDGQMYCLFDEKVS